MLRVPRALTITAAGVVVAALEIGLAWAAAFHLALAVAAIVLVAGLVVVLTRPEWLLVLFVATQPWEHALAFPTAQITIPKLLGVALLASWLIQNIGSGRKLRWAPNLSWAAALFLFVLFSFMLSLDPSGGTVKTLSYFLYVLFAFLFVQLVRTEDDVRRVLRTYTLAAAAAAGYSLIGFLAGHGGRAGGPVDDPNDFAFILAVAVPFAVYFLGRERPRLLWAVATLLLSGGILATFSRGAILGLLAVALWGLATGRVPVGGVLAGGFALILIGIVGYRTYQPLIQERLTEKQHIAGANVASRQAFWSAALQMAESRPLSGVGPQQFGAQSERYILNDPVNLQDPVVHNGHLEILAEDGIFALFAWLGLLATSWRLLSSTSTRLARSGTGDGGRLCTTLQASLLCSIVAVMFLSDQLKIPVWLISAMAAAVWLAHRAEAPAPVVLAPAHPVAPALG